MVNGSGSALLVPAVPLVVRLAALPGAPATCRVGASRDVARGQESCDTCSCWARRSSRSVSWSIVYETPPVRPWRCDPQRYLAVLTALPCWGTSPVPGAAVSAAVRSGARWVVEDRRRTARGVGRAVLAGLCRSTSSAIAGWCESGPALACGPGQREPFTRPSPGWVGLEPSHQTRASDDRTRLLACIGTYQSGDSPGFPYGRSDGVCGGRCAQSFTPPLGHNGSPAR